MIDDDDDFFDFDSKTATPPPAPVRPPVSGPALPEGEGADALYAHLAATMNEEQLAAVVHSQGPLLVLAGAGSGKTRVITHKIAWLVDACGLEPWNILAVTFTNKAAAEMRVRSEKLLGPRAKDVWLGTFHSTGLRLLRRHADLIGRTRDFVVYDQDDKERLLGKVLKEMRVDKEFLSPKKAAYYIEDQCHVLRGPDSPDLPRGDAIERHCATAYKHYEQAKLRSNAVDFNDLIVKVVQLFEDHPPVLSEWQYKWRYIMVDEFQDTDRAQVRLLRLLAGERANLCVVGDDDQSIYRWRGAEVRNILDFPQSFDGREVGVVRLERNYRSTANILRAASSLIAHNRERHDKTLRTEQAAGEQLRLFISETETGEARWVVKRALEVKQSGTPLNEIAIFYRTHSQSRVFEDALRAQGIPYNVVGGLKFYERKEIKDVLAYLRLIHNLSDDIALLRVLDAPPRGIGDKTIERVGEVANALGLGLFEAMEVYAQSADGSRARKAIETFRAQILKLRAIAEAKRDALEVATATIKETGFEDWLKADKTHEAETRVENLQEFLLSVEEWRKRQSEPTLTAFIDHVSLLTSLDEDARGLAMTLMTVHAAKGLEFDAVFVTGLEEDVFPHFNSKDTEAIEEERRLAYVAITRGRDRVFLSYARSRQRFGRTDMNPPSRFIREIAPEVLRTETELGSGSGRAPAWAGGAGGGGASGSSGRTNLGWATASKSSLFGSGIPKAAAGASSSLGRPSPVMPHVRPSATPRGGRPDLDYSDSQVDPDEGSGGLRAGTRVLHPRFGTGKVIAVEGQGPDAKATVRFPIIGDKFIVAKFLTLAP